MIMVHSTVIREMYDNLSASYALIQHLASLL